MGIVAANLRHWGPTNNNPTKACDFWDLGPFLLMAKRVHGGL
jgi:hypothetical protein